MGTPTKLIQLEQVTLLKSDGLLMVSQCTDHCTPTELMPRPLLMTVVGFRKNFQQLTTSSIGITLLDLHLICIHYPTIHQPQTSSPSHLIAMLDTHTMRYWMEMLMMEQPVTLMTTLQVHYLDTRLHSQTMETLVTTKVAILVMESVQHNSSKYLIFFKFRITLYSRTKKLITFM